MAIAVENTPSTDKATQTGTGSSVTISGVVVGADESLVVCAGMRDGGATVSSVTWNTSESLTKAVGLSGSIENTIWTLPTPTATTANVVCSWSASRDRPKLAVVYVLSGADTADLVDVTGTDSETTLPYSDSPNTALTTTADGNLVIDFVAAVSDGTNPTFTVNGAQTQTINEEVQGFFGGRFCSSYKTVATAGATTMEWTQAGNQQWTHTAVAINNVGGGGPAGVVRSYAVIIP